MVRGESNSADLQGFSREFEPVAGRNFARLAQPTKRVVPVLPLAGRDGQVR